MKFSVLELLAFGPFDGTVLDFSRGNHGLHLVYGPNEAGKSSALRAVRQVLYGIDERTVDGFRTPNTKLRIGATVASQDGNQLSFLRRKGRKETLRTPDDAKVVPDARLDAFLSGVGSDVFGTMFGIDHAALAAGGRMMLEGEGELGQILFAAGSGLSGLRRVQQELQQELEALYKPRGQKQRLNELLTEFEKQRKRVRDDGLADSQWLQHDGALREHRQELERVDAELKRAEGEKNRLERIRAALPAIGRWKQARKEMEAVAEAVLLPEDFATRRQDTEQQLRIACHDRDAAARRLEELEKQLAALPEPGEILDAAEAIGELHARLQVYQKAMRDLPNLIVERDVLRGRAESLLRDLRPDLSMDCVAEAFIPAADRQRIRQLAAKSEAVASRLHEARRNLDSSRQRAARLRQELSGTAGRREIGPLQQFVRRTLEQGNLDAQLAEAGARLAEAEQSAAAAASRLAGFSGTPADAARLPVPELKTVERFQQAFTTATRRVELQTDELEKAEQNRERTEKKIAALLKAGPVPTEDLLQSQRELRDVTWRVIRQAWRENLGEHSPEVQELLTASDGVTDLADVFEQRIRQADELADQLRLEAERVSKLAQLQEELDHHADEVMRLRHGAEEAQRLHAEVQERWELLWRPLGVEPLPPPEMAGWLALHGELVKQSEDIIVKRQRVADLSRQIVETSKRLRELLMELGEPESEALATSAALNEGDAAETLTARLDLAQLVVQRVEDARRTHIERRRQLDEIEETLPHIEQEVGQRESELKEWQAQWTAAVAPLGLVAEALPAEAEAVLDGMQDLAALIHEAEKLDQSRIRRIDSDARQFVEDAAAVMNRVVPELAAQPVEAAVVELQRRADVARSACEQRQDLAARRQAEQACVQEKAAECAQLESELGEMCRLAGVAGPAELPQAEERSTRRRRLEVERETLASEILHHSGGLEFDDFLIDASTVDADTLEFEIERLREQVDSHLQRRDVIRDAIKSDEHALEAMDGGSAAADAAATVQNLQAAVVSTVEEYVPLRLALEVLKKGMERYQRKHRGPVLERAGELFARLTCGSFEGLHVDLDGGGRQVLVGLRANTREQVALTGMSDGTADQLYLALRLASLAEYLDSHEPLPFIVDDILVDFDDARAAAALEALAELSARTQVIFFTHHRHLVEIAREVVSREVLVEHELGVRSGAERSGRLLS